MDQFVDSLLEMRFLEPASRGHPNCFIAVWGYLSTAENDLSQDGGHND